MASTQTVVLITGGNRGLGLALVKRFLAQPNHTVITTTRNPSDPTAQALSSLPTGPNTKLVTLPYDASNPHSAKTLIISLQNEHGITHLDIVLANAGISKTWPLVRDAQWSDIRQHVEVNVLAVVALYQATRDLLMKSKRVELGGGPVFVGMGSLAGGLAQQPPVPSGAYGPSKCMLNWYGVRINAEEEWLTAFILDPGWVQTDMGQRAAEAWGMEGPPVGIDESADGMFRVLTTATKETVGGKHVSYMGEVLGW